VTQTIEEKNKAFVLEAFDTLFNKRDYAAAERFWSPNYIQHSAHIRRGMAMFPTIPTHSSTSLRSVTASTRSPLHLCLYRTTQLRDKGPG
jgi:hypothetical protein